MNPCPNCSRSLSASDSVVQCDGCSLNIHQRCTGLSADDRLTRQKARCIKILCDKCINRMDEVKDLKNMIQALSDKLESVEKSLLTRDSQPPAFDMESVVAEVSERMKRASNVIVRGVPESADTGADTAYISDVLKIIAPGTAALSTNRIGKLGNTNDTRPRMIKATLSDPATAKVILRNQKKLLGTKFSNLKFANDRTPAEIQYLNDLRQTLNTRIDQGQSNLTIKYIQGAPKIVDMSPKK